MGRFDFSFYKGKKVLITGHTGFKGSWLCKVLSLIGANITGYSLQPPTSPSLYDLLNDGINTITADIRDITTLKKTIKDIAPEIIFHMAAQPLVRESYNNPVLTYETNVMGTVNLLEACRGVSSIKSIVNVTTDKVYENKEWHWGYRENETLNGRDPYSNSKSCAELVTYSYKASFFDYADAPSISTARSGNVIGGGDFSTDRIVPDCVRAAVKGEKIILRNPHSIRPYQHVLDTLFGYLMLGKLQYEDKTVCGSYNFGPDVDGCVTTGELATLFCNAWGSDAEWETTQNDGPHEAGYLKLDCSKANNVLRWNPCIPIKKAVDLTVEWTKCWVDNLDVNKCMDEQIRTCLYD
ncbi:MAG: CDP-glucose 4,6-dehydratase [Defluviitaleaceae bacterium]|nr:CDP-glucose 4,6-dehydratase [Defluviitaleaceae bacterium]